MSNKVKNVKFHITWKGHGCINYNGSNVSNPLRESGAEITQNDNVSYGKRNFYCDEDGNIVGVPKVSSNCIRHYLLEKGSKFNPQAKYNPYILANFLTSTDGLLRGHMITIGGEPDENEDGEETENTTKKSKKAKKNKGKSFTRKTPMMTTDAETTNGIYNMETFVSGAVDENGEKAKTSFYMKETLGKVTYESEIVFNVAELQFLCFDPRFGKKVIPSDVYETGILKEVFEKKYGYVPYDEGVFTDSSETLGEYYGVYGYRFNDRFINQILNDLIKKLWEFRITKAGGYLEVEKIEMYAETDPVYGDREYVNLERKDCGSYEFEYEDFWKPGHRNDFE